MKYGNFVGGGWLPISDEEMKQMKDFFKSDDLNKLRKCITKI
jgi:hypothetical protein